MKRVLRILLVVLLLALIAAAALAWHYRSYLRAFSDSRKYTTEDLQQKIDDNNNALEEILSEYLPPNEPEQTQVVETPGEVTAAPLQQEQAAAGNQPTDSQEAPQPEKPKENPEINEIVAAFNALREDYLAKLDAMKNRAYQEYKARTFTKKELVDFAAGFVREATKMEVECDKQVFALLEQLENSIKQNGGDPTLPDKILEVYLNEKQLTKAKYISELEKRGLIL